MKKAFVHDWIFHIGWAESVFFDLVKEHSSQEDVSMIFTLFSDKSAIEIHGDEYQIKTALPTWINSIFKRWSEHNISFLDYRNLMPFYPQLCWLLRRKILAYNADATIISSFATVKNIILPNSESYRKISNVTIYLHSPNQYIRENTEEYTKKITWYKGRIFNIIAPYLRKRDAKPRSYNKILCNSNYTKKTAISLYWEEFNKAKVVYPAIDPLFKNTSIPRAKKDYFVYVWRITSFVRELDKIIMLFNSTWDHLLVLWSGPDEDLLKDIAWPTITFVWRVDNVNEKISIMKYARWFINLTKESCWMATMEAIALWLPVFWYNKGWTSELVWADNGLLVDKKDEDSLKKWFEEFKKKFG